MADSIRERILAALASRLTSRLAPAGDGSAEVPVRRNPGAPQDDLTAVDQYDGGHERESHDTGQDRFRLDVELELYAPTGTALNALYARVRAAVDIDRTFGDLAEDAVERGLSAPVPNTQVGHPDVLGAVLTLEITFTARDGDVTAQL